MSDPLDRLKNSKGETLAPTGDNLRKVARSFPRGELTQEEREFWNAIPKWLEAVADSILAEYEEEQKQKTLDT